MAGGAQSSQAVNQFGQINQLSQLLQQMGAGKSSMPMAAGMSMMAQQPPTPQPSMAHPVMPGGVPQPMTTPVPQMQPIPAPQPMMGGGQGMSMTNPQGQMLPWQAMLK